MVRYFQYSEICHSILLPPSFYTIPARSPHSSSLRDPSLVSDRVETVRGRGSPCTMLRKSPYFARDCFVFLGRNTRNDASLCLGLLQSIIFSPSSLLPAFYSFPQTISTKRFEYPHSLSYHETIFAKLPSTTLVRERSTIDDRASPIKSEETIGSSVTPKTPR